jgi:hypothetical protein
MRHATAALGLAAGVALVSGCGPLTPSEIPVGGAREQFTREDLATARDRISGCLLEPGWLPEGFELVNVGYQQTMGDIVSVDLHYRDAGGRSLHIWQAHVSPEELGNDDPLGRGELMAIGDETWDVVTQADWSSFSTRFPDGRTVSVDGDLSTEEMRGVVGSIQLSEDEPQG